jgi:hypothetical protein
MPSVASPRAGGRVPTGAARAGRPGSRSRSAGSSRAARPPARPGTLARVRWEQLGRLAMVAVMVAIAYLYLSAGVRMFSTWRQARHDDSTVRLMEAEHTRLSKQHELLSNPETVENEARRLGLIKKGERQYVLSGLPDN